MKEQSFLSENTSEKAVTEAHFELHEGDQVEEVAFEKLPKKAAEYFEKKRFQGVHPDELPAYEHIFKVTSANGNLSFVAEIVKIYSETYQEQEVYIVNVKDQDITGYIEIATPTKSPFPDMVGRPFVGYIRTRDDQQHQGLGRAKLFQANAYTLATYGKPLHSDTRMQPEIESIWKRLVDEGKAMRIDEPGDVHQYRFCTPEELEERDKYHNANT